MEEYYEGPPEEVVGLVRTNVLRCRFCTSPVMVHVHGHRIELIFGFIAMPVCERFGLCQHHLQMAWDITRFEGMEVWYHDTYTPGGLCRN